MELASILAGGSFSDRPECASPVIAAFLRSYNDHVDAARRADLYPYAALVVGTRDDETVERLRARSCMRWAREVAGPPPVGVRVLYRLFHRQGPDADGVYAARAAAAASRLHRQALELLDELLACGGIAETPPVAFPSMESACAIPLSAKLV
jgi:hypothetical protein